MHVDKPTLTILEETQPPHRPEPWHYCTDYLIASTLLKKRQPCQDRWWL